MLTYSINDIVAINQNNDFLVYQSADNPAMSKNIFFVGSCRMTPLMFYLHVLYPNYNLYNIYVPYWTNQSGADTDRIQSILNNTDYVITETVRNCNIFNTDKDINQNFFNTFDIQANEIRICNLELHMYHHDLHNVYKIDNQKDQSNWFIRSRERLKTSLISKQQNFIWKFIENNLQNIRLFATHNHPTAILSIASFMFIAQQMNATITMSLLQKIMNYHFLEGHFTPILPIDIEVYGFEFPHASFSPETINHADYKYVPQDSEKKIHLETLENLFSYL